MVQARAEAAAARIRDRIAAIAAALPGIASRIEGDGVTLSGRRLRARRLADPRLRWIAGWLR